MGGNKNNGLLRQIETMKTSVIEWIPVADRRPEDRAYVLGAFLSSVTNGILVFAMFYDADKDRFMDADHVKRGPKTKEPVLYWAPVPSFPES